MPLNNESLMNTELGVYQTDATELAIYLKNGIRLTGKVLAFDNDTIKISGKNGPVLVERGAVATVQKFVRDERETQRRS